MGALQPEGYREPSCPLLLALHQRPHVPPHCLPTAGAGWLALSAQHAECTPACSALLACCPLAQDGYKVELLPKLAFFALWDGPPPGHMASDGQLAVSPWMADVFMLVWRAGACPHDGLTYQSLLPCSKGLPRHPSFGCHAISVHQDIEALLRRVWPSLVAPSECSLCSQPRPLTTSPSP